LTSEDDEQAGAAAVVDNAVLRARLAMLRQEHADMDAAVQALSTDLAPDMLRMARLKKRKLQLRDQIASLEDRLTPDIIA
jgi:hypothetical protein